MKEEDVEKFKMLQDMTNRMSLVELKHFCDGVLMSLAIAQKTFKEKFPEEFKKWDDEL